MCNLLWSDILFHPQYFCTHRCTLPSSRILVLPWYLHTHSTVNILVRPQFHMAHMYTLPCFDILVQPWYLCTHMHTTMVRHSDMTTLVWEYALHCSMTSFYYHFPLYAHMCNAYTHSCGPPFWSAILVQPQQLYIYCILLNDPTSDVRRPTSRRRLTHEIGRISASADVGWPMNCGRFSASAGPCIT
jgi:hypothetical protein